MREVDAEELELCAVNTGRFYDKHKRMAFSSIRDWIRHVTDCVIPEISRDEPVYATTQNVADAAFNLRTYYQILARETAALRKAEAEGKC